jgi:hypothetical protein
VEALNIHPGEAHPPVIYTHEHGNISVGHMENLSLSDSPVNSDTNEELYFLSTNGCIRTPQDVAAPTHTIPSHVQ